MRTNIVSGYYGVSRPKRKLVAGFMAGFISRFMRAKIHIIFNLIIGVILSPLAYADNRMIISARGSVTSDDIRAVDFDRYEIGLMYALPWSWQWPSWSLSTQLLGSAGALEGGSKTAFIGSIGAGLMVSWDNWPMSVDIGVSPTYVSEDIYDDADIGGKYHFTSHIAIRGWIADSFSLGYRFQHTSNASSQSPNPGVDSHMIELGYRF